MSEFDNWFNEQDIPLSIDIWETQRGFLLKKEITPLLREGAKFAWDFKQQEISILKSQLEKAEKALEFYSNDSNWFETEINGIKKTKIYATIYAIKDVSYPDKKVSLLSGGKRAREYFKEKEQNK